MSSPAHQAKRPNQDTFYWGALKGVGKVYVQVRTNGFVERMNKTLLDACFRVKGRETFYITIDEIQRDLDEFMAHTTSSAPISDIG